MVKKTTRILDFDDTLCYPSPFRTLKIYGDIEEQHRVAQTKEFIKLMMECPPAPWLAGRLLAFRTGKNFIVTGRHEYHRDITEDWLKRHNIPFVKLHCVGFENMKQYLREKDKIFSQILEENPDDIVEFYEDSPEMLKMGRSKGFKIFRVEDGQLVEEPSL